MHTIITLLRTDHDQLTDMVSARDADDVAAIPALRRLLSAHAHVELEVLCPTLVTWDPQLAGRLASVLAEQRDVRALATALDAAGDDVGDLTSAVDAVRAWLPGHVERSEADLLRPAEALLPPAIVVQVSRQADRLRGLDEPGDEGASSDGDSSWAASPITQDPGLDRSVDAAIRRSGTGGRA